MIYDLTYVADFDRLHTRKQTLKNHANRHENEKRIDYDYQIDDQVYIKKYGIHRKLDSLKLGLFPITDIFTNGDNCIQRGAMNERFSIHQLEPHYYVDYRVT